MELPLDINGVKGFLDPEEGKALYEYCLVAAEVGPDRKSVV